MAGFELTLYGRIWVTPKGFIHKLDKKLRCSWRILDCCQSPCVEVA